MLGVLLSTQAWQPARFAVGRLARRLTMSAGVVTETVEIDGQTMEVERFVEADVGMEFPKVELTEKIFDDPTGSKKDTGKTWPDEFRQVLMGADCSVCARTALTSRGPS